MSTQVRESLSNLKVGYSHQVEESERQNYSSTQVSLSEDKSPIRLEKKLKIEGGQKAKKILIFDKTKVSVFRLYFHLSNKFDFFLMILGLVGSIFTGASNPIMAYLTGSTTSEASLGTEGNINSMNETQKKIFFKEFKKNMDKKVSEFLIYGMTSFIAAFMSNFFWYYASLRQMHHLKEKYFARILMQEQGWFDQNNVYEFATKVQVQLDQIELGVGEKFGTLVESISTFITGLIISFLSSWKLTLIILCVSPFLALCTIYMITSSRKSLSLSRKAYETAGGIAEEVLYNIKTVVSFGHFDFEKQRFGYYADLVRQFDAKAGFKYAIATAGVNFFSFLSYFFCILYARSLLSKENNNNIKPGDIMTVCLSTIMAISSFGMMAPNISIIQEACIASSDYFTLVDRKIHIIESESNYMPSRDTIKGRI